MMKKEIVEGCMVCVDCILWSFNGQDSGHGLKILQNWDTTSVLIEPDYDNYFGYCDCEDSTGCDCAMQAWDDGYFSKAICDGCASDLAGQRWDVSIGLGY